MAPGSFLGEFEHLVLLTVLQLGDEARALDIRAHLEGRAERSVSRGALYATLERLERKDLLTWVTEDATPERGGTSQRVISRLSAGLDEAIG